MSLFRFRWFRSTIRKHTRPIPHDTAALWKRRLSQLYLLLSFHIAGLVLYSSYSNDLTLAPSPNKDMTEGEKYRPLTKGSPLSVYEVRGFKVTNTYEVLGDSEKTEEPQ